MSTHLYGNMFDPFTGMHMITRELDRLFSQMSTRTSERGQQLTCGCDYTPVCDTSETDDSWIIHAELPGVDKDAIHIEVQDGVLILKGEMKPLPEGQKSHRSERRCGKFERRIELPKGVDPTKITASYNNGILEIVIPKPKKEEMKKPLTIPISVGESKKSLEGGEAGKKEGGAVPVSPGKKESFETGTEGEKMSTSSGSGQSGKMGGTSGSEQSGKMGSTSGSEHSIPVKSRAGKKSKKQTQEKKEEGLSREQRGGGGVQST